MSSYNTINVRKSVNKSGEYVFPIGMFNNARQLKAQLAVTAAAGGTAPTLDVTVLQSYDGGVTYDATNPLLTFTQITNATATEAKADGGNPFSGDLKAVYAITGGDAHGVLNTDPTGANNKQTWTGKATIPSDDNATSVTVVAGEAGSAIAVAVSGSDITVTLAKSAAVAAVLSTALTGANNDLDYAARTAGVAGNSIAIVYVDPMGNDAALSVSVSGTTITVSLATDGAGAITSTAQQVMTAINRVPAAVALVGINLKSGNTGAGVVTALASTALATGADAAITSTAGNVATAVAANADANALVGVANFAGNDGTGLMTALAKASLDNAVGTYVFALTGFAK